MIVFVSIYMALSVAIGFLVMVHGLLRDWYDHLVHGEPFYKHFGYNFVSGKFWKLVLIISLPFVNIITLIVFMHKRLSTDLK